MWVVRVLLLFVLAGSAAACAAGGGAPTSLDTNPEGRLAAVQSGEKALIVLSAGQRLPGPFGAGTAEGEVSLFFRRKTPIEVELRGRTYDKARFSLTSLNEPLVLVVEPGDYTCVSLAVKTRRGLGTKVQNIKLPAWDKASGKPAVCGFSVKPGDVVNLGHLQLNTLDGGGAYSLSLAVEERGEAAGAALRQVYPAGTPPLQTRLLDLKIKRI